ncbi:hypothetical protein [Leptospira sp. GIMC2001]|uniref:hypothetical protein n=1 Tax=Leptospira sp. GIMC2001 TaxID=1513297 RepID=UPI00234ABBA2|nr:hypothetical protein [Leptospira sp. GIMC2001]WCL51002.1 hypothetical protein O4O04_09375 [Leptospira sp. GIMC2001]
MNKEIENDQTSEVIRWFLNNELLLNEATKTVAYWHQSPSEIDLSELKDWIASRNNSLLIDKVDFTKVVIELFI